MADDRSDSTEHSGIRQWFWLGITSLGVGWGTVNVLDLAHDDGAGTRFLIGTGIAVVLIAGVLLTGLLDRD